MVTNQDSTGRRAVSRAEPSETKLKLLRAAEAGIIRQGFAATTVDEICSDAGVTKGSFFHYFESKDEMAREVLNYHSQQKNRAFAAVLGRDHIDDPLDQIDRLLDVMIEMVQAPDSPSVCLVGMMAQELAATNEPVREVCATHFGEGAQQMTQLLREAQRVVPTKKDFDPEAVALMFVSLLQGSMLMAKTTQNPDLVVSNIEHGRAYIRSFFKRKGG